ncbi:hypothetical protein D3C81_1966250 [compost metagenome]
MLGDRDDQAQIVFYHFLARSKVTLLGQRCEMDLFRHRQQRTGADLIQVMLGCIC